MWDCYRSVKWYRVDCEKIMKNDEYVLDKLQKAPSFLMVLTGIGDYAYCREDGVFVVPI